MYYVDFNSDNKISGFFNDSINESIPESAIPITDEKWQELTARADRYILQDGEILLIDIPQQPVIPAINFTDFNTAMLGSEDYALFLKSSNHELAKGRLELAAVRLELKSVYTDLDWTVFIGIWNMVADAIPNVDKLKINQENLNDIAINANMPFRINDKLQLHKFHIFT